MKLVKTTKQALETNPGQERKFYTFTQNNSGGSFREPALYVIIEAYSKDSADCLATQHGVYFDGCDSGEDCDCCGDRWCRLFGGEKGNDKPSVYDEPLDEMTKEHLRWRCSRETGIPYAIVVYMDGHIDTYNVMKKETK